MTNPNEPGSGSEDSAGQQPSYQPPPPPQGGYQPPPPPQGGYQPPPPPQGGYQPPPGQGSGAPQGYGGMPQQSQGGGMGGPKLAEMPIRLVARIIDGVLIGIVFTIVYFALFVSLAAGTNATYDPNTGVYNAGSAGMSFFLIFVLEILVYGVLTFGYEVTMIALRGATVGKQLMGVMVV
ncbi:MAG: RDD family protein, partial [Mycobacteriaceae bacterium]